MSNSIVSVLDIVNTARVGGVRAWGGGEGGWGGGTVAAEAVDLRPQPVMPGRDLMLDHRTGDCSP